MTSIGSPPRTALVVAGMHRSGTSAMARMLGLAGGDMPDRLITAAADNPLGFWEPRDMVSLNDEILRTVGSAWDDIFGFRADALAAAASDDFLSRARSVVALNYADTTLAVVKDPRVSLLVSLWRQALEDEGLPPAFVIMVRDPLEVARSVAARDQTPVQGSMLSWLSHMVAVERDTRGARRVFVSYAELIEDWRPVLDKVRRELAMPLPISAEQEAEISRFLTPSARHHVTDEAAWIDRADIWPGVAQAWRWLKAATHGTENLPPFPETIVNDLVDLEAQVGPVLKTQAARAALREQELQAVLADRETALLRLKAQAQEYKSAEILRAQAVADAEARAAGAMAKAKEIRRTLDQTARTLEQTEATLGAAREETVEATRLSVESEDRARRAEAAHAAALAQAAGDARLAADREAALVAQAAEQARLAAGREAALVARAAEDAHLAAGREAALHESIGGLNERCETLVSRLSAEEALTADMTMRLTVLTRRLDDILSSASWSLTRPVRVVSKRLKSLSGKN